MALGITSCWVYKVDQAYASGRIDGDSGSTTVRLACKHNFRRYPGNGGRVSKTAELVLSNCEWFISAATDASWSAFICSIPAFTIL